MEHDQAPGEPPKQTERAALPSRSSVLLSSFHRQRGDEGTGQFLKYTYGFTPHSTATIASWSSRDPAHTSECTPLAYSVGTPGFVRPDNILAPSRLLGEGGGS